MPANSIPSGSRDTPQGIVVGILAYGLWGLFPIYWRHLAPMSLAATMGHRILWTFLTTLGIVTILGRLPNTLRMLRQPRTLGLLGISALLIGVNWTLYVHAVKVGKVVEASLGYYINPLVNVAAGTWILKEKLTTLQRIAVGLATLAVLWLTLRHGHPPWLALILAGSFSSYSLLKKKLQAPPLEALSIETFCLMPFALLALAFSHPLDWELKPYLFLASSGAVTLLPLFLFNAATAGLRLSTLGFIQYLSPTIQLLLAVLLYHEPLSSGRLYAFILIWIALLLYSSESWWHRRTRSTANSSP